jgi:hypothetical protein
VCYFPQNAGLQDEWEGRMNIPVPPKSNISNQSSDAHHLLSFGQLFNLHYELEETISAAAKDGRVIRSAELVRQLLSCDPHPAMGISDLHEVVRLAAARAGVKVRSD